jgi:hypothetical protein
MRKTDLVRGGGFASLNGTDHTQILSPVNELIEHKLLMRHDD